MIWVRAVLIFLLAATFAILAAFLADESGYVLIRWFGVEIETTGAALLSFFGIFLMIFFILRLLLKPFFAILRR